MDYIDWSCPAEMKSYEKAKIMENNQADTRNWQLGAYICRAISLINKGKYPEKPMFQSELKEKKVDPKGQAVVDRLNFEMRMKILEKNGYPMPPK